MSFAPDRVETVTVDSYGTLVDTTDVEEALASRVDDPGPISATWRSRSLLYTMVSNDIDAYQPFYEMNRDGLQYALDRHGVDLPPEERDEILARYHELEVFDDVRDGIQRLRDGGYPVYVVSNGNPEMLASMVDHADIGDLVVDTVSAAEIETFKPSVELYRHAAARTGTPLDRIVHVAGPTFDVQGAMHAGMQGAWLDRGNDPWGTFDGDPDLQAETFHDVADALGV
ncbi:haloacid dehalogenase type II [Halobacteriales archaeon Cl-PHB]